MKSIPCLFASLCLFAIIATPPNAFAASAEKTADKDAAKPAIPGDPLYLALSPIVLPVIDDQGVQQIVSLLLSVQVTKDSTRETLRKNMPRVMDALFRHLYGGLGTGSLRKGKLVNVTKVKEKSLNALSEIVDRSEIVDVLVEGVSQRML